MYLNPKRRSYAFIPRRSAEKIKNHRIAPKLNVQKYTKLFFRRRVFVFRLVTFHGRFSHDTILNCTIKITSNEPLLGNNSTIEPHTFIERPKSVNFPSGQFVSINRPICAEETITC